MNRDAVIGVLAEIDATFLVDWSIHSVGEENNLERRINLCERLGHRLTDQDKQELAEYVAEGLDDDELAKRAEKASYDADFRAELKRAIAAE